MTESESLSPMIYFDTDGEEFVTLKVLKEEETEEPSVPSSSSLPPFNDDWIVITEMKDELPVAEVSEPSNGVDPQSHGNDLRELKPEESQVAHKRRKYCKEDAYGFEDCLEEMRKQTEEEAKEDDEQLVKQLITEALRKQKNRELFPPICKLCGYQFTALTSLIHHYRSLHAGMKLYQCTICNRSFTKKHSLKTHALLHTGKYLYNCARCDRGYMTMWKLIDHIRSKHLNVIYSCRLCPKECRSRVALTTHIQKNHPKEKRPKTKRPIVISPTMENRTVIIPMTLPSSGERLPVRTDRVFPVPVIPGSTLVLLPPTTIVPPDNEPNISTPVVIERQTRAKSHRLKTTAKNGVISAPPRKLRAILPKSTKDETRSVPVQQPLPVFDGVNDSHLVSDGVGEPMMKFGKEFEFMSAVPLTDESDDDSYDYPVLGTIKLNDSNINGISLMAQLDVDGVQTDYPMFIDGLMIDESV